RIEPAARDSDVVAVDGTVPYHDRVAPRVESDVGRAGVDTRAHHEGRAVEVAHIAGSVTVGVALVRIELEAAVVDAVDDAVLIGVGELRGEPDGGGRRGEARGRPGEAEAPARVLESLRGSRVSDALRILEQDLVAGLRQDDLERAEHGGFQE